MTWSLTIEFLHSASPLYKRAVRLAEKEPGYHTEGEGREVIHTVTYTADNFGWQRLRSIVGKWRGSVLTVAGQTLTYKRASKYDDIMTCARARTGLQRRIDSPDRDIDALVYQLYGLTGKEIAIVELKT